MRKIVLFQRGFSVIELIGGLLLISLLAAVSTLSTSSIRNLTLLRSEARAIARFVERGIIYTSQRGKPLVIEFTEQQLLLKDEQTQTTLRQKRVSPSTVLSWSKNRKIIRLLPSNVTTPASVRIQREENFCIITISLRIRARVSCG